MTKAEYAFQAVRGQILAGELRPGSIIDQETLSADLELSTTPVREALSRLAAEKLVLIRAHKRVQVAPLSRDEMHEIYTVRVELEPFAAALGAEAATDAERLHAQESLNLIGRNAIEALQINREFHRSIYQASHNEVLSKLIESLADRADRYRMMLVRSDDALSVAALEHEKLPLLFAQARVLRCIACFMIISPNRGN